MRRSRRLRLRVPSRHLLAALLELLAFAGIGYGVWLWLHPLGIIVGCALVWLVAQGLEGEDGTV